MRRGCLDWLSSGGQRAWVGRQVLLPVLSFTKWVILGEADLTGSQVQVPPLSNKEGDHQAPSSSNYLLSEDASFSDAVVPWPGTHSF